MTTVRSTHNSTISTTITACILSSIFSSCVTYFYYHHQHHRSKKQPLNDAHNHQQPPTQDQSNIEHRLNEQRLAERRGRIKAEVRLRSLLKEKNESQPSQPSEPTTTTITTTQQPKRSNGTHPMLLRCIGTVTTPFTKRMGTPRQGALAPHSRGYIQLDPTVAPMETLHGIEEYSHIWLLFAFHANTDTLESRKTKIRPPRKQGGGGRKTVGTMASRSPHRPNAIGLSLVKVGMVDEKQKRLYVSALDLVNGTPVYDIKPVVPWDIPGYFPSTPTLTVPTWVSQDDTLHNVTFTPNAEQSLVRCVRERCLAPLYLSSGGGSSKNKHNHNHQNYDSNHNHINNNSAECKDGEIVKDDFWCAKEAIREVLAQDPRGAKCRGTVSGSTTSTITTTTTTNNTNKTKMTTATNSTNNNNSTELKANPPYRVVFGGVRLEFVVVKEGTVEVVGVEKLVEEDYCVSGVDGVPFSKDGTMGTL